MRGRARARLYPLGEAREICRSVELGGQLGTSQLGRGNALLHWGRRAEAARLYRKGLAVYRELGDETFAARMTNTIAHALLAQNDIEGADGLAREALVGFAKQRDRIGVAEALDTMAAVAAARADPERAAMLDGAANGIQATIASQPAPFERAISRRFIDASQAVVDAAHWRSAWDAGRELTLEAAVDFAFGRVRAN